MSFQSVVYIVGTPICLNGHPYGGSIGNVNTVNIDDQQYVFWADVLRLFGTETDTQKILRAVQPIGGRTESVNVHATPHPRILVPRSSLHQNMTLLGARLDEEANEEIDDEEDDFSPDEQPNSDDETFIVDDVESLSVYTESDSEKHFTSSDDDADSEELLSGHHRKCKRQFPHAQLRPAKYSRNM